MRGAAQDDVEPLGPDALDGLQSGDVTADLQDRAGLDVAGQLGVRDLVLVGAPARRPLRVVAAQQEVRETQPGPVEERRLVDDVGPARHRVDRRLRGAPQLGAPVLVLLAFDPDDPAPVRFELGQVALFVLEAPAPDDVELGIVPLRAFDQPGEGGTLELGQVLAGEIGDEVGGRIDGSAVDRLHRGNDSRGP